MKSLKTALIVAFVTASEYSFEAKRVLRWDINSGGGSRGMGLNSRRSYSRSYYAGGRGTEGSPLAMIPFFLILCCCIVACCCYCDNETKKVPSTNKDSRTEQ